VIRVVLAEDSAVAQALLVGVLQEDGGFEIVGVADNGEAAVTLARQMRPDVILMDVYMPRLNGLEATRQIMESTPVPIVMTSASFEAQEAELTFAALEVGALAIVPKPVGPGHPNFARSAGQLSRTLKTMSEVKVVRRWPKQPREASRPAPAPAPRRVEIIAIGVSTGGPKVLADILGPMPADLPVPIHVVQHIASGFVDGFVHWLGRKTDLAVRLAAHGERSRPGTIYIAPDGAHLGIGVGGRIMLSDGPPENGFRPSASFLLRSVAAAYRQSALGILLTGMGSDGANGLLALRRAGGMTVVQDEASSVVFGMPGEAVRLGAAELVLPPERIAEIMRSVAGVERPVPGATI
jgi:two-component system, chemotaxis family, protein-glutamate methylesterase/glutaminase